MKKLVLSLGLAVACASCASVSVIPRIGQMNIDGHIGIADASSGISGTNDLKSLGLEDDDAVFSGRVDLKAGGTHGTLALSRSNHDGQGTAQVTMDDGSGNTVTAGDPVDCKFDLTLGEAIVTWDFVPGDDLELGLGLGLTVFDLDAKFTDLNTGDTIEAKQAVPIPVLAARAGIDLGRVDLSALLGGMMVNISGDKASLVDLDLMARVELFGAADRVLGGLVVGYRFVDMDVEYEDDGDEVDAEMELSGPYIGLSIGF